MSTSTTHLSLPFIQGGQAQKHVTHNEAIRQLDSIVQLSVLDQVQTPMGGEQTGDRYIIAPGATEAFAGHDGKIALHDNGGWIFLTPNTGWIAFDEASGEVVAFNGTIWGGMGTGTTTFTPQLGINATADATNRLAVSSDASLLNHGGSGGHQVKINKSGSGDTASLLFQTGYSGRAEMGTSGSDNFEIKVSADGSAFHSALKVDAASGFVNLPNTLQTPGQVVNAAGHLGTAYNYPSNFSFDPITTPGLPGAFSAAGYYSGAAEMDEFIAVDPNQVYRLGAYLRQESVSGNWSSFAEDERHSQYIGFRCYDADGFSIGSGNHARYRHNGQDSLTTLTQPLEPGDTVVHVANANGWNESTSNSNDRGLIIFEYKDTRGTPYAYYSRIEESDLFDLGDVNKSSDQITLNQPLPGSMGNPDHPNGIWPVGTRIANRASGWNYKFAFCESLVLDQTDKWYHIDNAIGGIDQSGNNVPNNFPPGTATIRPVFLANYSNRSGGYSSFPDTGNSHRVWTTGASVVADSNALISRNGDGSCSLKTIQEGVAAGSVEFAEPVLNVTLV